MKLTVGPVVLAKLSARQLASQAFDVPALEQLLKDLLSAHMP